MSREAWGTLPASFLEMTLEDGWGSDIFRPRFLQIDVGREDRIVGLFSDECLKLLCDLNTIPMDGTFREVPKTLSQLYNSRAEFLGQVMPLCYFLLPKKDKEAYVRMFCSLKNCAVNKGQHFETEEFQLDFEVAALRAIERCFPAVIVEGCSFH